MTESNFSKLVRKKLVSLSAKTAFLEPNGVIEFEELFIHTTNGNFKIFPVEVPIINHGPEPRYYTFGVEEYFDQLPKEFIFYFGSTEIKSVQKFKEIDFFKAGYSSFFLVEFNLGELKFALTLPEVVGLPCVRLWQNIVKYKDTGLNFVPFGECQ